MAQKAIFPPLPQGHSLHLQHDRFSGHHRSEENRRFPVSCLLYLLTKNVNRYEQFRTAFDEKGNVGIYSNMEPCYTIFHKEQETFSNLWTEYSEDFSTFLARYKADLETYGNVLDMDAKPNTPPNTFPVSMVPWTTFTGFHLHLQKGYDYLLPIFTLGKAWGTPRSLENAPCHTGTPWCLRWVPCEPFCGISPTGLTSIPAIKRKHENFL